uniref:Uncharacterized protein n=1 Tax=Leersia perrieri TaxID=77586 RepID=A0A0D9WRX3_9ORYZ
MMRSSLAGSAAVVRPGTMAARAPSRPPSVVVHLPRCTGSGPAPHRVIMTAEACHLPKTATALAPPWVDDDDVTEISIHDVLAWSAEEAIQLIKQTPPPPPPPSTLALPDNTGQRQSLSTPPTSLPGAHDMGKLLRLYERHIQHAETQAIDALMGTRRLVLIHMTAWESYEPTRSALLGLGCTTNPGIEEVLVECIRRGSIDVDDGRRRDIQPRLLAAFGVKPESMPANLSERSYVGAVMFAAMEMRNVVWRRVRRLRRAERRKLRQEEEEGATRKKEEKEAVRSSGLGSLVLDN